MGAHIRVCGGAHFALCSNSAVIEVGDDVLINWDTKIIAMEHISIGSRSAISWNVSIMDSDLHIIDGVHHTAPVNIGEHVLICAHAVVLKGVTVGDGAVVAAGSVVTVTYRVVRSLLESSETDPGELHMAVARSFIQRRRAASFARSRSIAASML